MRAAFFISVYTNRQQNCNCTYCFIGVMLGLSLYGQTLGNTVSKRIFIHKVQRGKRYNEGFQSVLFANIRGRG